MIDISDYFDEERIKNKKCIVNLKGKRYVFREEKNGKVFFIKKYTPHGKRKLRIYFGIERDQAKYNQYISDELTKIGIDHVKPLRIEVKKGKFFDRESVLLTEYGGETLLKKLKSLDLETQKKVLKKYFYAYKKMAKAGIYVTDYNYDGALLDENNNLKLIDFDTYKKILFFTKKKKKHLIDELRDKNQLQVEQGFSKEIVLFVKEEIDEIEKIL